MSEKLLTKVYGQQFNCTSVIANKEITYERSCLLINKLRKKGLEVIEPVKWESQAPRSLIIGANNLIDLEACIKSSAQELNLPQIYQLLYSPRTLFYKETQQETE